MKYFIFLAIIVLCIAPVIAQEGDPEPPQVNQTAQTFLTRATSFADANFTNPGFKQQYINDINAIVSQIDSTKDLSSFNVDTYMNGVESQVGKMLSEFPKYAQQGTLKEEYLKEVATGFMKEYAQDMKNYVEGSEVIPTQTYLDDFPLLNQTYINRLQNLNTPPSSGSKLVFDPNAYLDQAAGTKGVAKMDFYWGGVDNHWLNYNMIKMMDVFQKGYSHDSVMQADFDMLQKMWPQGSEVFLMNSAYSSAGYYEGTPYDSATAQTGSYMDTYAVDEYGGFTRGSAAAAEDFDVPTNVTTTNIGPSYNNRSWGYNQPGYHGYKTGNYQYKYYNGTSNVLSVTTNGHKYVFTETVYISPLVLDMDGDGAIQASEGKWLPHSFSKTSKVAEFDMTGDGFCDITEWVGPKDGLLLVYDEKKEEVDANDLFGNAGGFDHGYEKLSLLDKNNDKVISGEELATLSVWRDLNSDAKVDKDEIKKVQEMGITLISLGYDDNLVSYFVQDGTEKKILDWYPCLYEVKKTK